MPILLYKYNFSIFYLGYSMHKNNKNNEILKLWNNFSLNLHHINGKYHLILMTLKIKKNLYQKWIKKIIKNL